MLSAGAIIVAAGSGKRMQSELPKPYLELNGQPILYHTIKNMLGSRFLSEMVVVVAEDIRGSEILSLCIPKDSPVPITTAVGGEKRQDSVYNGLKALRGNNPVILVHDGVRPFIKSDTIDRCIQKCSDSDGVVLAIPSHDTLKIVKGGFISGNIDRENIWHMQTPQFFKSNILSEAFTRAKSDKFYGTDEVSLVERISASIHVAQGDPRNIKITTRDDLMLANSIIKQWENDE